MKLLIDIGLDNDAFTGEYLAMEREVEKLLQHIGEQIFAGHTNRKVIDSNGNCVGDFKIVEVA